MSANLGTCFPRRLSSESGAMILRILLLLLSAGISRAADLRVGIIGLDTSHVTAFTKLINDANDPKHVPGGRVVAAFKSSSADIESSASRVEEYTHELSTK